ncbi:TIGR00296 family protein [Thermococcus piezophilus]|uniref:Protein A7C91_05905 n=1 Tax=Thermococcus piezophilus TaxID=1712654 RepID=A0A172WH31_9EURY|nr:TIGR00296 family protein [Thermococcus piezophilus]ANF22757.1 AMMECR1 domain-containing protein [Thermococcus piezophilus]
MYRIKDEWGEFLVMLARRAIEEYVRNGRTIEPPEGTPPELWEKMGVFVTLNRHNVPPQMSLRGCIGFPLPIYPLVEATIKAAIYAAIDDPRFPPVKESELDDIVIEVSVLTPPEIIEGPPEERPRKIKVGQDGLIIEKGIHSGLLLPQVPVEWGWDEEEFLAQICWKAGLPPDCWLDEDTKVYRFTAEIFEEEYPMGPVRRKPLV